MNWKFTKLKFSSFRTTLGSKFEKYETYETFKISSFKFKSDLELIFEAFEGKNFKFASVCKALSSKAVEASGWEKRVVVWKQY